MAQPDTRYITFTALGTVPEDVLNAKVTEACNGCVPERTFPAELGLNDAQLDSMWFVTVPVQDADRALAALQALTDILHEAEFPAQRRLLT